MSMEIKYTTNDLETVVESDGLPDFNARRVDEGMKLNSEFALKKYFSPVLADIGGIENLLKQKDSVSMYYREGGSVDAYIGIPGFDTEICPDIHLECKLNQSNDREMKIKTMFKHDTPHHSLSPFRVVEDALLISNTDPETFLKRIKTYDRQYGLFIAPVTKAEEVVEKAKRIHKKIGEAKLEELRLLKNSCRETVNDPELGEIIKLTRRNRYKNALLEAMGAETDYIFMEG